MEFKVSVFITGLVIGVSSALAQAFLGVKSLLGYGVCMVGHPRDLMGWLLNRIFGINLGIQQVSLEIPVLTALGVLIGSVLAAMQHNEFRFRAAHDSLKSFVLGFIVVNFGLLVGACPLRAIVYAAYGDLIMLVGLISIIAGALAGAEYIRRRR